MLAELDGDVKWIRAWVRQPVDDAAHIFDLDGPASVALEDVDPGHVGSDLTEPCRQHPERAGPIRHPHPDHISSQTSTVEKLCERDIADARTLAEPQEPGLTPLTTAASFTTCVASTFTKPASDSIFSHAAIETGLSWNLSR
jgi:hypothetical protein